MNCKDTQVIQVVLDGLNNMLKMAGPEVNILFVLISRWSLWFTKESYISQTINWTRPTIRHRSGELDDRCHWGLNLESLIFESWKKVAWLFKGAKITTVERWLHEFSKKLKSSEFLSLRVTEFWSHKVSYRRARQTLTSEVKGHFQKNVLLLIQ